VLFLGFESGLLVSKSLQRKKKTPNERGCEVVAPERGQIHMLQGGGGGKGKAEKNKGVGGGGGC